MTAESDKIEKPPLGLRPRTVWQKQVKDDRIDEIMHALERYSEAGVAVPIEWLSELGGLLNDV